MKIIYIIAFVYKKDSRRTRKIYVYENESRFNMKHSKFILIIKKNNNPNYFLI